MRAHRCQKEWRTVSEESSASVVTLVDGDTVTGLVKLVGGSETRRSGSDNGDFLAGTLLRRTGLHPSHLETLVDCEKKVSARLRELERR